MRNGRVAVVGGGVIGCISAIEIKKKGFDVTVFDQSTIGNGSSWASGGILFPLMPWDYLKKVYDLCKISPHKYAQLSKDLIKFPSVTPKDAGAIKFLSKKLKKLGFNCKILEFKGKGSKPIKNLYARIGKKGPKTAKNKKAEKNSKSSNRRRIDSSDSASDSEDEVETTKNNKNWRASSKQSTICHSY